jgi:hypothetical protein
MAIIVIARLCKDRAEGDKQEQSKQIRIEPTLECDIHVEVTTGEGATVKLKLPASSTVLIVKQEVGRELGIAPGDACIFIHDEAREEKLEDKETLHSFVRSNGGALHMMLLVERIDAQQVVPEMSVDAAALLGISPNLLDYPQAVAFLPEHPELLITTELFTNRVKISNISTGLAVCEFGESGTGPGQFNGCCGIAVATGLSISYVLIADRWNNRVQVLRLVVNADGTGGMRLEFVRVLSSGHGNAEGQMNTPIGVAILKGEGGGDTVLVTEQGGQRVSQFTLDGIFLRVFAGTGKVGVSDGQFSGPNGVVVLGSSAEVAIADRNNHRIQIFDSKGKYKRQFGSKCSMADPADGRFSCPCGVASDAYGNLLVTDNTTRLQVFSPEGKHLCTRNIAAFASADTKGIAWGPAGALAVANESNNNALLSGLAAPLLVRINTQLHTGLVGRVLPQVSCRSR